MLRRKVTDRLLSWKNNSNKALLVTGARQIGKSYAIRAFGKDNYASYFEANLLLDAEARDVLIGAKNAVDFINPALPFLRMHRLLREIRLSLSMKYRSIRRSSRS